MNGSKVFMIFLVLFIILLLVFVYFISFAKDKIAEGNQGDLTEMPGASSELIEENTENTEEEPSEVKKIEGTPLAKVVEVGDYVLYKPDKEVESYVAETKYTGMTKEQTVYAQETNWRVFSKDEEKGQVILISEEPLSIEKSGKVGAGLSLKGYNGYNNAVYLLNDICNSLYSKHLVGKARSINIEDIEEISEFEKNMADEYGKTIKPENTKYPIIAQNEKGIKVDSADTSQAEVLQSEQKELINGVNIAVILTGTSNAYSYLAANYIKEPYDEILLRNKDENFSYWIASRTIFNYRQQEMTFEIFNMSEDIGRPQLTSFTVYRTDGIEFEVTNAIRPVIVLSTQVVCTNADKGNGENIAWTID